MEPQQGIEPYPFRLTKPDGLRWPLRQEVVQDRGLEPRIVGNRPTVMPASLILERGIRPGWAVPPARQFLGRTGKRHPVLLGHVLVDQRRVELLLQRLKGAYAYR